MNIIKERIGANSSDIGKYLEMISNDTLMELFEEAIKYRDTGDISKNSRIFQIEEGLSNHRIRYYTVKNYVHEILYEMGRRYYNFYYRHEIRMNL